MAGRSEMMRSVLLLAGLCGVLAGCSLTGGSSGLKGPSSGDGVPVFGTLQGRVFTKVCGGLAAEPSCAPTPYRGEIVFCSKKGQIGVCPAVRVDANGRYRIVLHAGRHYLVPAPGTGNVVVVPSQWVQVVAGQTRTVNVEGGSSEK
jgi:hypothetical protein